MVFLIGGRQVRGRELRGQEISAADFEFSLKEHSDGVALICSVCKTKARHRRGRIRDGQPRDAAHFYASHETWCHVPLGSGAGSDEIARARHYILGRDLMDGRVDGQGRRILSCTLSDVLAVARSTHSRFDVLNHRGRLHSFREFVVDADELAPDAVGAVLAVHGRVASTEVGQKGVFLRMDPEISVFVPFAAANDALIDSKGCLCIAIGVVQRARQRLLLRVESGTDLLVERAPQATSVELSARSVVPSLLALPRPAPDPLYSPTPPSAPSPALVGFKGTRPLMGWLFAIWRCLAALLRIE